MERWGRQWWGRAPRTFAIGAVLVVSLAPIPVFANQVVSTADLETAQPTPVASLPSVLTGLVPVKVLSPEAEAGRHWYDDPAGMSFVLPPEWVLAAQTSLNPQSDPPEPTLERARFQLRAGDPGLYAAPVPITSALVQDAGALISLSLAREGTELAGMDADGLVDAVDSVRIPGFIGTENEVEYEGIHVLTRTLVSKTGGRVVVVKAYTAQAEWNALAPSIRTAIASLKVDAEGPNAEPIPAPAPPAPPPPPPVDATQQVRAAIIARAQAMLGTPYVWGGNTPGRSMDCSAYVSATWAVARYTTDSIGRVSFPITKNELRAGDAMNLTIGRDPARTGHIRLFEAWANEARTLVWVYEETPPRAVHRVIAYDDRYQPIRLAGLSGAGEAALIPAPISVPERLTGGGSSGGSSSQPRQNTTRSTPKPTFRATPTPTLKIAVLPEGYRRLSNGQIVQITPSPTPRATVRATPTRPPEPTVRTTPYIPPLPKNPPPPKPTPTPLPTIQ